MLNNFCRLFRYLRVYVFALFYFTIEKLGIIKVQGDVKGLGVKPLLIVGNHPSLFEATSLPFLRPFFVRYARRLEVIPYSTPAAENLWRLFWPWQILFGWTFIPIHRKDDRAKNISGIKRISNVLDANGSVVLFPEGTRTFKTPAKSRVRVGGREMGYIPDTNHKLVLRLARTHQAEILPVYTSVSPNMVTDIVLFRWPVATIVIGKTSSSEHLTGRLEQLILSVPENS